MKLTVPMTPARAALVILAVITGVYHIALLLPMMVLNGLGYLGLLAAYFYDFKFVPVKRPTLRWIFIGYTAITIILYFVLRGAEGLTYPPGLVVKAVELALLVLLFQDR